MEHDNLNPPEEVLRPATPAADSTLLGESERRARQPAERTLANLASLQAVTAALSEALTPAQVAGVVLNQGLQSLGAHAGMIALLDAAHHELVSLATVGYPANMVGPFQRILLDAGVPLSEAVRTGRTVLVETTAQRIAQFPNLGTGPRRDGMGAVACLPLMIEQRVLGGMSISMTEDRPFEPDELLLMQSLARLGAQALERARLFESELEARARAETIGQRFSLLADAGSVLGSSLDYRATLSQVARLVVPRHADWCVVHIVGEDGSLQQLEVAHVDPAKLKFAEELNRRYPADPNARGGVREVIKTGRSEYMSSIPQSLLLAGARDEEHARLIRELALQSYMIVPLLARGRVLGAISLVWAESGRHYEAEDVAFIEELARRAALAIDNARLYSDVQQANAELERRVAERTAELQQLSAHLQTAREDERADIARELHDDLAQNLAVIKMELHQLARRASRDLPEGQPLRAVLLERLDGITQILDDSVHTVRSLVAELRLDILDELGLRDSFARQVEQFHERTGIAADFESDLPQVEWDRMRSLALYRVLQESLSNVANHAHATQAQVRLAARDGRVLLEVRDNGRGITPADLRKVDHFGIRGMRERIALLGGDINIHGAPGEGTVVDVRVPLNS